MENTKTTAAKILNDLKFNYTMTAISTSRQNARKCLIEDLKNIKEIFGSEDNDENDIENMADIIEDMITDDDINNTFDCLKYVLANPEVMDKY